MKYLKQKPSGIYEFRRRVPGDLVTVLGKREFKTSLKTRNESEAVRKLQPLVEQSEIELQKGYQRLLSGDINTLTFHQAEILAHKWLVKMCDLLDTDGTRDAYLGWVARTDQGLETLQSVDLFDPERVTDGAIRKLDRHIDDILTSNSLQYEKSSESYTELRVAFNQAALQLSHFCFDRLHRREATINAPLAEKPGIFTSSQTKLSAIAESYLSERAIMDDLAKDTIAEFRSCLSDFIEHFGDVEIKHIGRNEVRNYRNLLLRQPKSKQRSIRQMSPTERASYAERENLETVSKATVRRKLRLLSPMFSFAVESSHIEQNPFSQQTTKLRNNGGLEQKKTFTNEDLSRLFSHEIFTTNPPEILLKRFGEAIYWLPVLLYYTGARREEICQLYSQDVRCVDGTWSLDITDRMPDQRLKTEGSRRTIPIHPDLLQLGFVDYCRQQDGLLFPALRSKSDDFGNNIGKWYGKFIRSLDIEIKQPIHGFRHTFKTLCRSAGIADSIHDAITGHAPTNVGGTYGEFRLELLEKNIAKLPTVPGFDKLRTRKNSFPTGVVT